jgi:3-ketosteroid 9alpha-monooxygenase subunit A
MAAHRQGLPHQGYPSGWFQVAWSAEIAVGDVAPLHYFGHDLVAYRTESGVAQVLDAHCPHMGAHLGHGGTVCGEDVVCPFHGWRWDPFGVNTLVPTQPKPITRRSLRSWPTHESNGIVWLWHDAARRDPLWPAPVDMPGFAEGERFPVHPSCVRKFAGIRMQPQFVPENNVDIDHLSWVHGAQGPVVLEDFEIDQWCFRTSIRITYGFGKARTRLTPNGPIDVVVPAEIWGLGYQFTHFPEPDEAVSVQAQTPIDDERCDMFQTVLVYRRTADPDADPAAIEPSGMALARVREQIVQIERDIPIWENMLYRPNAALTRSEARPVGAIRRWARQFYPDSVTATDSSDG